MNSVKTWLPTLAIGCSLIVLAGCGPSKSELAREIASLTEQLEKRQSETKTLQDQAAVRTELESARSALAETKSQLEATRSAQAEVRTQLEAARSAQAEVRTQLETAQQSLAQARSADNTKTAELQKSQAQLAEKVQEHARHSDAQSAQLTTLQQQLDLSRTAERGAASERDSLAAELRALRERVAASEVNLEQEQKRASDLTDRLAAAVRDQGALKQSGEKQRAEIEAIAAALADAQAKVARLTGARGIYTVQDGDSLSSIALYFYRNAYRWPGIAQANRHLINHPDRIFPAMVLIIPK